MNVLIKDNHSSSANVARTVENIEIGEFSDLTKTITELLDNLYAINKCNYNELYLNILIADSNREIDASSIKNLSVTASESRT